MSENLHTQLSPVINVQSTVEEFSLQLSQYLSFLGLPADNVLVDPNERRIIINNLPDVVNRLTPEARSEAKYMSKFIAACGAGLFDAALNFLWNETVVNLRQKVTRFDLEYFLNSVVSDSKRRATLTSEQDLPKLDDWELIRGCKNTGIITEIGFKHLDYIREMRNYASAAHPNQNDLDGLQLSSWLQTCIREVLSKEPEGPVLEVRRLLDNLRHKVLASSDVPPITHNIKQLPKDLVDSTIRAVFGMFTDPELASQIRNNLKLISPALWSACLKQARQEIALKYAVFSANAETDRKQLAHDFLSLVGGLSMLPEDQRALDMDQILDSLYSAHYGLNNFYKEPPHASAISRYVPNTGEIPDVISEKYTKVIVTCRIGNNYGVSTAAEPTYDRLLAIFREADIKRFILLLWDTDLISQLSSRACADRFQMIASELITKTTSASIKKVLDHVRSINASALSTLHSDPKFYALVEQSLS